VLWFYTHHELLLKQQHKTLDNILTLPKIPPPKKSNQEPCCILRNQMLPSFVAQNLLDVHADTHLWCLGLAEWLLPHVAVACWRFSVSNVDIA